MDIAALAAELRPLLVGARVDKAYQPAKDQVLLRVRRKGSGKLDLLCQLGRFVTVTRNPPDNPGKPSMVAQVLRTALENARVVQVRQLGFDRILELTFERGDGVRKLVYELFGDGNIVLVGGDGRIELPMRGETYEARAVRRGEPYQPPPSGLNPLALDEAALRAAGATAERDLVRLLALDLGLGPLWAEEMCLRAGIDKRAKPRDLDGEAWGRLHAELGRLAQDIARNDLAPAVVHENKEAGPEAVDAVPFVLRKYPAPRFSHEETATFREALDAFFVGAREDEDDEELEDPRRARYEAAHGKAMFQVRQVEEAITRFRDEEAELRADGEALYGSFGELQEAIDALNAAREKVGWTGIEDTLAAARKAGHPMARRVQEVRPHEGTFRFLAGQPGQERAVWVDLRQTVQQNAEASFAAAKKARSRREGAEAALHDARAKLRELEERGLAAFGPPPARTERLSRHFWFESYRWTFTPSGLVAVGGRSAAQNDAVVKKYLRPGDRYVHAEIHGAPSVVLRHADQETEPTDDDLRVAGQFAVCASRGWRQFGHASAYWVTAAQVSKTPRSGEYVPKGAWMVHGKRNTMDNLPMAWAVAQVRVNPNGTPIPAGEEPTGKSYLKLVGGPWEGLAPFAVGASVTHVVPGTMDPNDAAEALAETYGCSVEEAQAVLPAGNVEMRTVALPGREAGASGTGAAAPAAAGPSASAAPGAPAARPGGDGPGGRAGGTGA